MGKTDAKLGLVRLTERAYGYLQKDVGLGWSNAGLIVGADGALLVDTLFDLRLTRKMLDEISSRVGRPIRRLVNTHHNGDHCWGNQLVEGAEIIAHRAFRSEMMKMPPDMTQAIHSLPAEMPGLAMLQKAMAPSSGSKSSHRRESCPATARSAGQKGPGRCASIWRTCTGKRRSVSIEG
jgi:hypothetical protein